MNINEVFLVGRAGIDPDTRFFESGKHKTRLTLAVDIPGKARDSKEAYWFNLEFWDKLSELADKYIRKGKQIAVNGDLRYETWEDRATGNQCHGYTVTVRELKLLANGSANNGGNSQSRADQTNANADDFDF